MIWQALLRVELHDSKLQLHALLGRLIELPQRHDALAATAQVDKDILAMNPRHAPCHPTLGRQLRSSQIARRGLLHQ
jgi:hypothetical protein